MLPERHVEYRLVNTIFSDVAQLLAFKTRESDLEESITRHFAICSQGDESIRSESLFCKLP